MVAKCELRRENCLMVCTDWMSRVLCPCAFLCCVRQRSLNSVSIIGQERPANFVRFPMCNSE